MSMQAALDAMEEQMMKTIEFVHNEFAKVRTGKASTSLVENVQVEAYGTHMRLRELAGIASVIPQPAGAVTGGPGGRSQIYCCGPSQILNGSDQVLQVSEIVAVMQNGVPLIGSQSTSAPYNVGRIAAPADCIVILSAAPADAIAAATG